MKIAIYHNLPSGGAKRAVFETTRRLVQRHSVDVYTLSSANHSFCDLRPYARRYHIYNFEPLKIFLSPWGRLNQWQRLRTFRRLEAIDRQIASDIDREQYDLVYVHPSMWLQAPMVLSYLRTPSVYHVHESLRAIYEPTIPRPYLSSNWREKLNRFDPLISWYRSELIYRDRQNVKRATVLLANSRFTASTVENIYLRQAEVAYFGVDSDVFQPSPVNKEDFVLSVGELQPAKGYDFLIHAIAQLPNGIRPSLRIISNTNNQQEYEYLMQLALSAGVKLTIEIMVSLETLVQRYNEARLFVYAPVREPFGLAALEAMACATPVVGVAEGGVRETVVDGITGILVPRDPANFAAAVQQLLENPDQAQRMGKAGRQHVLNTWSWASSVDRIERLLASSAQQPDYSHGGIASEYVRS